MAFMDERQFKTYFILNLPLYKNIKYDVAILFTNTPQFRISTMVATMLDNTDIEHFHRLFEMICYHFCISFFKK